MQWVPRLHITKVKEKFIIEFQMKCGKQMLSTNQIQKELLKSVVYMCPDAGYKSLFVLLCASGITSGTTVCSSNPNIKVYVCANCRANRIILWSWTLT